VPAVDYEAVNVKMRALIASKPSHGRDTLLRRMAEIEAECMIPEDQRGYDDRPVVRHHRPPVEHELDGAATTNGAASHA
jgi:hypothetical protein